MRPLAFSCFAALALIGCKWSEFDDLADATWVRSTDEPGIGSRNFAIAIAGVTTGTSGGQLGVISDDTPDFSVVDYNADGGDSIAGNSLKLSQHRIVALTDPPVFTTDGAGKIALADRSSTGGAISVVFGPATAPAGIEIMVGAGAPPDAITFAGPDIIVAVGNTLYTLQASTQIACMHTDTSFGVAAMTASGTDLWVWSKAGAFFKYPLSALAPCTGNMLPAVTNSFMSSLVPASGARVHIAGTYGILAAHAPMSRMGQVFVVDLATLTQSDSMLYEGLRSSTLATFGTETYLALGAPDRAVDTVVAGRVDVHAFSAATGKLDPTAAMSLHDAQPESGALFGRGITTMTFNGQQILVVAGNSEVFAYLRTTLYNALP